MSMDILVYMIIGLLMIVGIPLHISRSKAILEQWAKKNGYKILHSEYRFVFRGPFFWNGSNAQTVYYVKVKDKAFNKRSGWVRCGSYWKGLFSDKAEVIWE